MRYNKIFSASSLRFIILLFIMAFFTGTVTVTIKNNKEIEPLELLKNSFSSERFISTDELAHIIISNDPSYLLIDLRDKDSFKKYSLPNAINIPLKELFSQNNEVYLNQDKINVILFSNDHFYADQAWILCNRSGYENLHVLKGGIKEWFSTIINPKVPEADMPFSDFELYAYRKAASMHFGVAYPEPIFKAPVKEKIVPKKVVPVKKKKKMPVEGGC
ncbi:MAG: rhodanese-like domain-containing protein [Flavobacteriaceae bacterium]|nr:rhodanese-like domain-containing protein [Flavobacteriaceae bacterium]